ncbi:unnamed protein product [Menidia menidia]|uniref:(Atlantic silverside) hypothetical protein n=1 Tax=Menidia menidia TaxID=238744 RepID=A0A8S4AK69_9TELE|nr:unnamed protein product [Menidia menidia]
MLGRGVKRKWSCLEELDGELLPASAVDATGQMSGPGHVQQRQLVLSLCLQKLQHYQAGVELSLRRSVLLINTLRQLQGETPGHAGPDALLGDDAPVTCPGCAEGDGLSPPESPPQEAQASPDQQKPPPTGLVNTFSDAANAMGYLTDVALDDIFEDIDTSMYETSDLPSAWAAGPLWPAVSVSLWPDEDVKCRAPGHSTPGSLQSCLMDFNELDHIMEILVKS